MTDYTELVKALRNCGDTTIDGCVGCAYEEPQMLCNQHLMSKAADAIEQLSKQHEVQAQNIIALLNEKPRWIPVTERLPEKSGSYLAAMNGETGEVYYRHRSHRWLEPLERWEDWTRFVSHWMAMPEPPKEEK